ncbi:unnamed protein product [Calypogeia fissa]
MAGGIASSQNFVGHVGENWPQWHLPERVLDLLHGNTQMPHKCRLFLGFVNILTVAIVVGLAMEGASPDGPQLQQQENDHDQADWSVKPEQDQSTQQRIQDHNTQHGIQDHSTQHGFQKLTVEDPILPRKKEDVEKPETSKGHARAAEGTSTTPGSTSEQHRAVCNYCTALAKKALRLLTECGYGEGEEHTLSFIPCRNCGGAQNTQPTNQAKPVAVHTTGGDQAGAAQEESIGCLRDVHGEDQRHLVQTQVTFYWRNRVLEILAPSLQPLPDLFNEFENMNESRQNTADSAAEGDQCHYQSREPEGNAHERSNRSHGVDNNEAAAGATNMETIMENEDNCDAIQPARVGENGILNGRTYDESFTKQQNSPQLHVEIQFPNAVPSSQPSDHSSEYPGSSMVLHTRPATPPQAERNDLSSSSTLLHSRNAVVMYSPTSAPTENVQPEVSNAPEPEYYDTNQDPNFIDAFYSGPPQYSSSDDDNDEISSQPSSSHSSSPLRSWSTPVPSGRPHLHMSSIVPRERSRPRRRALARRPRCGLRMMKALRDDPACTPEEGEKRRQPGREDKLFKPKRGDVICRHTVVSGRGVVETYLPGIEEHLQDGDSLVCLKMDNKSYPTMLIVSAKAYLFLQRKWIYIGRHQHGVRKPKKERLLG